MLLRDALFSSNSAPVMTKYDEVVQTAAAVAERDVAAGDIRALSVGIEPPEPHEPVRELRAHGAGVAVQRAADRAWQARQRL